MDKQKSLERRIKKLEKKAKHNTPKRKGGKRLFGVRVKSHGGNKVGILSKKRKIGLF